MNKAPDIIGNPPKPFPNSYWVEPHRLLAGEYPGGSGRSDPAAAVAALLYARVTCFIDLTQAKEMTPYEDLLESADIVYRRFPIIDHGIPRSPETITAVLAAIDAAFQEDRCVYLHCRAGIGRTGMAVGCYLIHSGLSADRALERLQVLWQQNARSVSWPQVPETEQQRAYLLRWRPAAPAPAPVANIDMAERSEGAMIGLALGDALARSMAEQGCDAARAISEITRKPSLATDAQTAMTTALAESLLTRKAHDAEDQLQRYLQWTRQAAGQPVPAELKRALATWQWSRKTNAGSHDPKNLDGHSLARTLAVVLFAHRQPSVAMELATHASRVTQQSPAVLEACRLWAALLLDAFAGTPKSKLLTLRQGTQIQQFRQQLAKEELSALLDGHWQRPARGDNAVSAVAAALLALQGANTFQAGLSRALSVSKNPAVAGALYGTVAGALFGLRAIPEDWRRRLQHEKALRALARRLLG